MSSAPSIWVSAYLRLMRLGLDQIIAEHTPQSRAFILDGTGQQGGFEGHRKANISTGDGRDRMMRTPLQG